MSYKDRFYTKYISTHVLPSEGEITSDTLSGRTIVWRKTFSKFLSKDKGARIIDLGCGYGSIVWWLQRAGYTSVSGVDISTEQIETGKSLGVTNIVQADIKEFLRDKKDCYDVIFARDIIEHFNKEEILDILSLCYESLKNEGRIIIQVPNAESPFGSRIRYGDFTHEIAFTTSSLSQLLRMVGFGEIRSYPHEPSLYWLNPKSLVRFVLWKVVEACYKFLLYVELGRGTRIVTQNIIVVATKT